MLMPLITIQSLCPFMFAMILSGNSDKDDDQNFLPSSCEDLNAFGHTLNGIYLAKEKTYNNFTKINAIFCNFKSGSSALTSGKK